MRGRRVLISVYRVLAAALLVMALGGAGACHLTSDLVGYEINVLPVTDKVDLLLVVDNSHGTIMRDKVTLFDLAIGELVRNLADQVGDMHIGVVTTSLGGVGAEFCEDGMENDHGRLISRGPLGSAQPVPTFQGKGVLVLDPQMPEEPGVFSSVDPMVNALGQIIEGAGNDGCAFESTLEAWYRFLVDPIPYERVELVTEANGTKRAEAMGVDETVRIQREAFLRPDSMLIIVVLSDENDCSLRVGGSYYLAAQIYEPDQPGPSETPFHLPRPRQACSIDPNSVCCTSCGLPPGDDCDTSADECEEPLSESEDPPNLRCYDQKRRFGVDFLYPIDRYLNGLGSKSITGRDGNLYDNPIFAHDRDSRLVLYASIIGVPWQDIARRTDGKPDIDKGLDPSGSPVGGFQSAAEMRASNTWDLILGDPKGYHGQVSPTWPADPLMRESRQPREGTHPLLPDEGSPKSSEALPGANAINGHEHAAENDIQYACIFNLTEPLTCNEQETDCKCESDEQSGMPLCQDPTGEYNMGQYAVQAYPGIRHLELMKRLGDRAVLGSICAAQGASPMQPVAYQPTAQALFDVASPMLQR